MTIAPPHNLEAERALLGAMIFEIDAGLYALDVLEARHFYRDNHGLIFDAVRSLHAKKTAPDELLVLDALARSGQDVKVGGLDYLRGLTREAVGSARVEHYCDLIRDSALLRDLIQVSSETLEHCQTAGADPKEILAAAEKRIMAAGSGGSRNEPVSLEAMAHNAIRQIENERQDPGMATGVFSGHSAVDSITGGWKPGQLIVLAARTSQGKTTLAVNWGLEAANAGIPVLYFSLEMSQAQTGRNVLSVLAKREMHTDVVRELEDYPYDQAVERILSKVTRPFWLDDTAKLTIGQLCARARRMKFRREIGLIIVDYLQLVKSPGAEKRHLEIAEITQGLKALAMDLDLPVIALAQLKREASQPTLSSLRESGSIEQDSDVVVLMWAARRGSNDRIVKVAKHRSGPTGEGTLEFTPETLTFHDPG